MTVRAYAPVGGHEELLPYLVRRLLENGANSSFVHALLDERVPASAVAADPIAAVEAHARPPRQDPHAQGHVHGPSELARPRLFAEASTASVTPPALQKVDAEKLTSGPIVGGKLLAGTNAAGRDQPL